MSKPSKAKPKQPAHTSAIPASIAAHHRDAYAEMLEALEKLPEFNPGKRLLLEALFGHRRIWEEATATISAEGVTMPGPNCLLAHPAVSIANSAADRLAATMERLGLVQKPRRQADPSNDNESEKNPWA